MRELINSLILLLLLNPSKQFNHHEPKVNEGASTSTQELVRCETCEIDNYATRMMHLMLAEDIRGIDLRNSIDYIPGELEAFHDDIMTYISLARHGAGNSFTTDPERQDRRTALFQERVRRIAILNIISKACSHDFSHRIWYDYDQGRNEIVVREYLEPDQCLCEQQQERQILETSFTLHFNIPHSLRSSQVIPNDPEGFSTRIRLRQYHIIPLSLLKKFFKIWLTGEKDNKAHAHMNGCVRTLYGRFKRSLQKLILARIKAMNQNTNSMFTDRHMYDNLFVEIFYGDQSWLSGNTFLGPENRGPFDPRRFVMDEEESSQIFEEDARSLVDPAHFRKLKALFHDLIKFINIKDKYSPLFRMLDGFFLFMRIDNLISERGITPMNENLWEKRAPGDEELFDVIPSQRTKMKAKKFWAIKQQYDRHPRSLDNFSQKFHGIVSAHQQSYQSIMTTNKTSHDLFSKFIIELMAISLDLRRRNENAVWLCNYTLLYTDYLYNHYFKLRQMYITKNIGCPTCIEFDEYLMSRILRSSAWAKCNNETKIKLDWCMSWRRIVRDLDQDVMDLSDKRFKYFYDKPRAVSSVVDVEIFVQWLLLKTSGKNQITETSQLDQSGPIKYDLSGKIVQYHDSTSAALCYLATFVVTIFSRSGCSGIFSKKN